MANSTVGIRRLFGDASRESGHRASAAFGATLALTVTLACAAFLLLMAAIWVVHPPHKLPGFFAAGGDQNQGTKTFLYVAAYAVIAPLALIAVPRVADAIAAGPNAAGVDALAAALAGSLALVLLFVKLSSSFPWGDGTAVVLVTVGLWGLAAAALLVRAMQQRLFAPLVSLAGWSERLAVVAGALVFGVVLCVTALHDLSLLPVVLGTLLVVGLLVGGGRIALPRLAGRAGALADIVPALLLLLVIPNLFFFPLDGVAPNLLNLTGVQQFHHDFLLGPANQVMKGGVLMANEPVSQWGVGSIYFLTAWFHLSHIGYGTYGLLDAGLTSLMYVAAYALVRVAGVARPLAIATLALGVTVLVYNLHYAVGGLPQQGPLRFGFPMGVVLPLVVGARFARWRRATWAVALVVLGLSSIWALEGFAYTLFALGAMACLEASLLPAGGRRRWLGGRALLALGACVSAHVVFALVTLAVSGQLPAWSQYLAFVHAFLLGGKAGGITYGFTRWSPGVAVAAAYLASAIAIVLLVLRRPELVRRERVTLTALAGTTAWGVALFSYFDNRAATYLLLYVALPALLMGTLWLSLVLRLRDAVPRSGRTGALAFALCLAVLLLSAAWPSIGPRFARSPLAEAFPGGHGLRADVRRLWHIPALDPRSPEGVRLVRTYMPGRRHVLMLVSPDLGIEILMRSGTANELPLGDPIEESFVASSRIPVLRDAIARLRPGGRMLLDQVTWGALLELRRHPSADPLEQFANTLQAPLQAWILQRLDRSFRLRPIYRDRQGFVVVQLDPRR
jgi:hypothetical protein